MTPIIFKTEHTADFHQIDPFGHMSTLHYLDFYLKNRFSGLREHLNMGVKEAQSLTFAFVNRSVTIQFHRPVFADAGFTIESHVDSVSEKECTVKCAMKNREGKLLSECEMVIACMDKKSGRLAVWPEGFMTRFYQEE